MFRGVFVLWRHYIPALSLIILLEDVALMSAGVDSVAMQLYLDHGQFMNCSLVTSWFQTYLPFLLSRFL